VSEALAKCVVTSSGGRDIDRAQCRSDEGLPSEVQGGWACSRFGCGRIAVYQLVLHFVQLSQ
jgi:hypothetical protein